MKRLKNPAKQILFTLIVGLLCLISTTVVNACLCSPLSLDLTFDDSHNVAVFKVQSVEKYAEGEKDYGYKGFKLAKMTVEKVFKGDLKIGQEFAFKQGGNGDCIIVYDEKSVGVELLFFLGEKPGKDKLWEATFCNRSNSVRGAAADLLYLEKMAKVKGKTRLSGTLTQEIESSIEEVPSTNKRLAGRKIIISGNGKTIELKTDKNGVYEIYDLPPGKYQVTPEKINGFKFSDDKETSVEVKIDEGSHREEDFNFEVENFVRGKIFDTSGGVLNNVCLSLLPSQGKPAKHFSQYDCTNENGIFLFEDIPPGTYVMIINENGEITAKHPFGTFYYPNALKRENAAEITIGAGDFFDNLVINAPQAIETITLSGVLLYEDGKPVWSEGVKFLPEAENSKPSAYAETNKNGEFRIRILKGQKGKLFGSFSTYKGEYINCPKLDKLISEKGERSVDIETSAIQIDAVNDLSGIEMKFEFPMCEKKYK